MEKMQQTFIIFESKYDTLGLVFSIIKNKIEKKKIELCFILLL